MTILQAIILAIIEGITEFLPVSSTGHMIIGSTIMGIQQDEFVKLFTVAIQFGTILSVVVLYWKRFFQSIDFYLKLLAGFIPAVIAGLLFKDYIDMLLENVLVVGIMLFLGGIVFLFIDRLGALAIRRRRINRYHTSKPSPSVYGNVSPWFREFRVVPPRSSEA
jgi:undecaprenyl-diphosphatase